MALNTSPSFMSGKSASQTLSGQVARQRATQRRSMPNKGGMMSSPGGMRPNPSNTMAGAGVTARKGIAPPKTLGGSFSFGFDGAKPWGNLGNPRSASFGYNPAGGGPTPVKVQGPPLMAAPEMDSGPMMGGGMVAANAPQDMGMGADMFVNRLRQRMGNRGITGGMNGGMGPQATDIQAMY